MSTRMSWVREIRSSDRSLAESVRAEIYRRMPPEQLWQALQVNREGAEREVVHLADAILAERGTYLSKQEHSELERRILDEIVGYGPLQPLIEDPRIQEIMINGPHQVWVERDGILEQSAVRFADEEHALEILHRIVDPLGRRIDL